jgi:hypothetical protein
MAAALLTSSFVAKAAIRPSTKLSKSNGSRTVMKAGNWYGARGSLDFICMSGKG